MMTLPLRVGSSTVGGYVVQLGGRMRRTALLLVVLCALALGLVGAFPAAAATTSAKALLAELDVRAEGGSTTYARSAFRYPGDADRDSCNTREEVLLAESRVRARRTTGCRITSGRWFSVYDGRTWRRPADVTVSHLVPFKEAWQSGARAWSAAGRRSFANDLGLGATLGVVTDDLAAAKGSRDPATWLPPRARCRYARQWVAVKYRWRLTIDVAERARLRSVLTGACGATTLRVPRQVSQSLITPPGPIPSAPSRPATAVTSTTVTLRWTRSIDDVGVVAYDVHRSRTPEFAPTAITLVGVAQTTAFSDAARPSGTGYYRVIARDGDGNASAPSSAAEATVVGATSTIVTAVGDIACPPGSPATSTTCRHGEVAQLIAPNDGYFIPLGDLQYQSGTYAEFMGVGAYDATFGALKARTLPVVGNHEHLDPAGIMQGYFDYFYGAGVNQGSLGDRGGGYYTQTIGGWQFIALDSECAPDTANRNRPLPGGCGVGSPQYEWLESVLASSTARCTLAAFHRPRWTTGAHRPYAAMAPIWDLMVASGVDVTLSGHSHSSEIFQRIGASGAVNVPALDPAGIRSFVAGSGGKSLSSFPDSSSPVYTALQARDNTTFGPIRLTLHEGSFDWEYTPIPGQTFTNAGTAGAFSGNGERCR